MGGPQPGGGGAEGSRLLLAPTGPPAPTSPGAAGGGGCSDPRRGRIVPPSLIAYVRPPARLASNRLLCICIRGVVYSVAPPPLGGLSAEDAAAVPQFPSVRGAESARGGPGALQPAELPLPPCAGPSKASFDCQILPTNANLHIPNQIACTERENGETEIIGLSTPEHPFLCVPVHLSHMETSRIEEPHPQVRGSWDLCKAGFD